MNKKLAIILILAFTLMITINALANIIPINGVTTGEVSDLYPNLFTPAPLTFSIWGVIYLLLLFFVIFQARHHFLEKETIGISIFFILSCISNTLWILAWHYQKIFLSLLIMLILLVLLIIMYLKIKSQKNLNKGQWFFLQLPFSIYLGWITVATIANITAFLVSLGFRGTGLTQSFWTVVVLLAATFITILMLLRERDIPYSCVVIWAFLGIIIERATSKPLYLSIIFTSILGILMIGLTIYRRIIKV